MCDYLLGLVLILSMNGTLELHVDPAGSDDQPGTREAPLATLEGARDALRRFKPEGRVIVHLHAGVYRLTRSFVLEEEDSGIRDHAIVFRGEGAVITGGLALNPEAFSPVTDPTVLNRIISEEARGNIKVMDLPMDRFDPLHPRGFPHAVRPAPMELFSRGKPLTLARWPNEGFVRTGKIVDPGSTPRIEADASRPARFIFDHERLARWQTAGDLWLFGYWFHDWADESIKVAAIDAQKREILLEHPHWYGVAEGKPFFAENLLEEIDAPGEYFIDREAGKLYAYAPVDDLALSLLAEPVIELIQASFIHFENLVIEVSRGDGFLIQGGEGVHVSGCTLRNLGSRAVVVSGGKGHRVLSCDIYDTGEGGILLSGGDRATLTPARHVAHNNDIHHYSRRTTTYRPGISLQGCGNEATNNAIHHAPHAALFFGGNDHYIAFNDIHHVLTLTGDGGAVYTGRDWTICGNEIAYNHFHDIVGLAKWENAVYMDDQSGSVRIFGNLFERCHWGMLLGGGRNCSIENNIFIDCTQALHFDARGLGWASFLKPTLEERLAAVPYRSEPWRTRYPHLLDLLDDDPMTPKGNIIQNNVLIRSGTITGDMAAQVRQHGTIGPNLETKVDWEIIYSEVSKILPEFQPLPLQETGMLRADPRSDPEGEVR